MFQVCKLGTSVTPKGLFSVVALIVAGILGEERTKSRWIHPRQGKSEQIACFKRASVIAVPGMHPKDGAAGIFQAYRCSSGKEENPIIAWWDDARGLIEGGDDLP